MSKKSTVYFEPVNGYLVRLYPSPTTPEEHLQYHGVAIVEIKDGVAEVKGAMGKLTRRNVADIDKLLREMGCTKGTWQRFDALGNLRSTVDIT
jgi:hypothetical protein